MARALIAGFLGCMTLACASMAQSVEGYYKTKPDSGGAQNEMCVANAPGHSVSVAIDTAYCPGPSPECFNVRVDSIGFSAPLARRSVHYDDGHGCTIDISFRRGGAQVQQAATCRDEEQHRDLEAGGTYQLVNFKDAESGCRH
ncbi:hypothetical protein HGR00_22480 [Ralstonia insidiosa]|uniref:Uncharacterized protein n=2 Tax=Ralstonia insidiosa TaxID=190721 RepID=A0A848P045_9RALS|nr:hypothetical protein [Ralstonia insidiosa]